MKHYISFIFLVLLCFSTYGKHPDKIETRTLVRLETNKGNILIALYYETPLHRNNFIKLTKQKYFDGTLFHRVINDFMIQGGDPDSKNAKPKVILGNGDPGYTIPAEFTPALFHKKGAVAAARLGDDINPKKESSGSQFYLVKGKVFSHEELTNRERVKNDKLRTDLIAKFKKKYRKELDSLIQLRQSAGDTISLANFVAELNTKIDSIVAKDGFHFSPEQREAYTTIGGVPHLDGAYTVFGEIIQGQDIVDKISEVDTDENDRPIEDIIILKARILK